MTIAQDSQLHLLQRSMWRYRRFFSIPANVVPVTLGEGFTPLIRTCRQPNGIPLYYKNETVNPTGSHKDRALSVSITMAQELGHEAVMLYSDGSTALSSAAYAARAGLRSITLVPRGTPHHRLLPLAFYDSMVVEYQGSSSEALDWTRFACRELNLYETTTYSVANPYGPEGVKTIALEIIEQLGVVPAWVIVPVGGGGTLVAIWRGFLEMRERGEIRMCPRMVAVLPAGYDTLERAWRGGVATDDELRSSVSRDLPETIQAKTAMEFPPDGIEAIRSIRDSDGLFVYATDAQAIHGQKLLGQEGIFAEPSASAVMVGVARLREMGVRSDVVAVVTGSGFRELGAITGMVQLEKRTVEPETGVAEIRRWLHGS